VSRNRQFNKGGGGVEKKKKKATKPHKSCKSNHSPPPSGGEVPSQPQGNGYLGTSALPLPVPPTLLPSMMLHSVECPFGQLGPAVPPVSPPSLLPNPSLLPGGGRV